MKTKIRIFTLLLVFSFSIPISLFANRPEIDLKVTEFLTLDLQIIDQHLGLDISLTDQTGNLVYDHKILIEGKFKESFNFTGYESGTYLLEISNPVRTFCYPIEVKKDGIKILEKDCKEIMHPIINYKDQKITLNLLNSNNEHVHAKLLNSEGVAVLDYKLKQSPDIHNCFDIKKLENGSYTFEVKLGDKTFSKTFMK